jgi:hypothetical protein
MPSIIKMLCLILYLCIFLCHALAERSASEPYDAVLEQKLKETAGVYIDESKRKGLEKTVFFTSCNYGFINHLHNFHCFAKRLGLRFLVMSMDEKLHHYIEQHTSMVSYLLHAGAVGNTSSDIQNYGNPSYHRITYKRTEAVYDVLTYGYDVLMIEVDIAIVRDPMPYILHPGIRYVHQMNTLCTRLGIFMILHHH